MVANACCISGRCSRTGRFRDPPPHSVLERQPSGTNQPDPFRNPRPHSGLLGSRPKRPVDDWTNPRMPGLERYLYIPFLLMGRFLLQGRRQNPGLPRTLKVLPHQRDTDQISRPVPRRSPPPDRPSRHWATQIPVRRDNTRKLSRHNLSAISPRSSSRGSDDRWRLCILTAMEPRAHTRTLQRRSLFVARVAPAIRPDRVTLERHGQPHIIHTGFHVTGRGLCWTPSRLL